MSFAFRALELENWLVYSGKKRLEFPEYESRRNLIIIHGPNGYGKTSLLLALKYIFEGERLSRDELLGLWHHGARDAGDGSLEVALELTHRGRVCKIVRGCDFSLRSGGAFSHSPRIDLLLDGTRQKDLVEDKIQELLPKDCLDVLFFDGADISRYALQENDADTREAIEKVLGIPAARNLREDLSKVIKNLESEQRDLLEESEQAQALLLEIGDKEAELERYQEGRAELLERRATLLTVSSELEAELEKSKAIENELELQREKRQRRAELDERIGEIDTQMRSLIGQLPLFILENPLRQIVEEMQAKQQVSPRVQVLDAQLRTLEELIEKSACLCEREIDQDVREVLKGKLASIERLLTDRNRGHQVPSEELVTLKALLRSLEARRFDPDDLIDLRSAVDTEREEVMVELAKLKKRLESHRDISVSDISRQIGQIEEQLGNCTADIEGNHRNIQRTETELRESKRERDQLGVVNEQARGVTRTIVEAQKAHQAVSELVSQLVAERRAAIQSKATEVFRRITNKPREYDRLELRGDYSLKVIRHDGSVVTNEQLSAGEKEVVAYSFITALNLASPDPAPFVMDTPFGHLDSGHRRGLLESLPELKVQAFLLATDRDLPPGERDSIDSYIAKEYVLKRDQVRAATLIEEEL